MTWASSAGKGARSFCGQRQSNQRSDLPAGAKLGPAHKLARDKKLSFVRAGVNACGGIDSALRLLKQAWNRGAAHLCSMSSQPEISQLVTAVFRAWQQANIRFLILRNYESLPHSSAKGIDVLVAPGQLRQAEQTLLTAASQTGFRLHNRVQFADLALHFSSPLTNAQARFDLFTALKWRGFDFVSCQEFLQRKVSMELFCIPHPADETATRLLNSLIYTGKVNEKCRPAITAGCQAEPAAVTELLARTYGAANARFLVTNAAEAKWDALEAATGRLRRAMVLRQLTRHPLHTMTSMLAAARRLGGRFLSIGRASCRA